jgi:hypothetical protein
MSSRLGHDQHGRLVAVVTTASPGLPVGTVFVCLGDTIEAGGTAFGWMGRTGRPPTPQERLEGREPYSLRAARLDRARRAHTPQERREVPDELLADAEAIEQARREQELEPADLDRRGPLVA